MNLLAIDTTSTLATVSVEKNLNLISNEDINQVTHSEKLLPLIDRTLKKSDLSIRDVDMFLTTNGPGSFTGCRIGVATIKALSHNLNKDIFAISSLENIAFETYLKLNTSDKVLICPILNAKNNRVYSALYEITKTDELININEILPSLNEDIDITLELLKTYKNILFTGDCIDLFREKISTFSLNNNLDFECYKEEINSNSKSLINYYRLTNLNTKESKMYNTYSLDVIYARVSQAERMKNE